MGTVEITRGKQITILRTSLVTDHDQISEWIRSWLQTGPVSIIELFDQARRSNIRDKSLGCVINRLVRAQIIVGDNVTQTYTLIAA